MPRGFARSTGSLIEVLETDLIKGPPVLLVRPCPTGRLSLPLARGELVEL